MAQDTNITVIPAPDSVRTLIDKNRARVNLVCGPRHSGKSDFALRMAKPRDLVWDYGRISDCLFPNSDHWAAPRLMSELKTATFKYLMGAATDFDTAWIVIQAPSKKERQTFVDRLNAKVFVIEATATYCANRAPEEHAITVRNEAIRWWSKYERVSGETVIDPATL